MGSIKQTVKMATRWNNILSGVSLFLICLSIISMTMGSLRTSVTVASFVANLLKNITCDLLMNTTTNTIKFIVTLGFWSIPGVLTDIHTIFEECSVIGGAVIMILIQNSLFELIHRDTMMTILGHRSRSEVVLFIIFYYDAVVLMTILAMNFNVVHWDKIDLFCAFVYTSMELLKDGELFIWEITNRYKFF